jgi:hypothetical protein
MGGLTPLQIGPAARNLFGGREAARSCPELSPGLDALG